MTEILIGYTRCSTDRQELAAQTQQLGVAPERIYVDKGLTGTNRARPRSGHGRRAQGRHPGDAKTGPPDEIGPGARDIADKLPQRRNFDEHDMEAV